MGARLSGGCLARRECFRTGSPSGRAPAWSVPKAFGMTEEQRRQTPAGKPPAGLLGLWPGGGVARRSKIHQGYSPSSRLAARPNPGQRTRSSFINELLTILTFGAYFIKLRPTIGRVACAEVFTQ